MRRVRTLRCQRSGSAAAGLLVRGLTVRVLGIDPGTINTGWGVIDSDGPRFTYVDCGVIEAGRGEVPARLAVIAEELALVIQRYRADEVGLESNFVAKNVRSAMRIGEARGVIMATTAAAGMRLGEYAPRAIKKAVAGHGSAGKEQVQQAIAQILGLTGPPAEDAADALAVGICHALSSAYAAKVSAATMRGSAR